MREINLKIRTQISNAEFSFSSLKRAVKFSHVTPLSAINHEKQPEKTVQNHYVIYNWIKVYPIGK